MKNKRKSIIKFVFVGLFIAILAVLSFVSIPPVRPDGQGMRSFTRNISLGLDLSGGVFAVYQADMPNNAPRENWNERMEATRTRLSNILFAQGYTDANVVIQGNERIRVEVPGAEDTQEVFDALGEPAHLEFIDHNENLVITGHNVVSASAGFNPQASDWVVNLRLDAQGARNFSRATASENHNRAISIYTTIQGQRQLLSAPTINAHITDGRAVITGMGSREQAQSLAHQIIAGQFDLVLTMLDSATISPTLGENALMLGLIAGIIGLILIMVLMIIFYRMFGVLSAIALLGYTLLMLFFLAALPWVQLTLPGIAGILLSIGMSVDGNIILFERIKDEYRNGKSIKGSVNGGLKKGFWTVFDAEITTVIAAVALLIFGTGPIQSFAITLLVGIVLAMFFNLVVIRQFIKWMMPLNSTSAKLYNLKRSKAFIALNPDETDITVAEREKEIEEAKRRIKEEKAASRALKKGKKLEVLDNETS